jgi:hypothetical protein
LTILFPADLLAQAREVQAERESLDDLVVAALAQEVRRRRALLAHQAVMRTREKIKAEIGLHPDSAPLIRALREGESLREY